MASKRDKLVVDNTTIYPIISNVPIPMHSENRQGRRSLIRKRVFQQIGELEVGQSFLVVGKTDKNPTKLLTIREHVSTWRRKNRQGVAKHSPRKFTLKNVIEKRGRTTMEGVRVWRIK